MTRLLSLSLVLCAAQVHAQLRSDGATASFRGSLPPKPTAALSADQEAAVEKEWAAVTKGFEAVKNHDRAADAHIFLKAVRYALDFDEWYDKKPEDGLKKAMSLLEEAKKRIESLQKNQTPWLDGPGQKVLGFYSRIDDSPQPYGVEVPEGLKWGLTEKPVPMWIWLHGRGDTATDLHFVYSRLTARKPGQFQPAGTIVIHPFGRYCNGWKSAGETDVFEARDDAVARFNVDANRIALAGFSMGGAGAWHLGAHYADQWACVHAGAGFVDVKRYLKLTPEKMPVWYEQTLWGVYDVPNYARNFFNVPLVVYSGEQDAQRDSAEFMSEILAAEGLTMKHFIGPGMGHKYHPQVIKEVQAQIEQAVAKGRDPMPKKVVLQTRCSRYGKMHWVQVKALQKAWEDTRVEAEIDAVAKRLVVKTKNVAVLTLDLAAALGDKPDAYQVVLDGQEMAGNGRWDYARQAWVDQAVAALERSAHPATDDGSASTPRSGNKDEWVNASVALGSISKGWGFDGPADQAFQDRFVIVLPDAPCAHQAVDQWVRAESAHFIQRWRSLMRGDPIVKRANDLTDEERQGLAGSLCLWGDPQGNSVLRSIAGRLPLQWTDKAVTLAGKTYDASVHVPVMACQWRTGRVSSQRVVLNSGLTFREAHDRTNSLQNPKLPDWAIIDITTPPTAEAPGKVVAADFFDEHWQVKKK